MFWRGHRAAGRRSGKDQEKETGERSKPSEVEAVGARAVPAPTENAVFSFPVYLIGRSLSDKTGRAVGRPLTSIATPPPGVGSLKGVPGLCVQGGLAYRRQGKQQWA